MYGSSSIGNSHSSLIPDQSTLSPQNKVDPSSRAHPSSGLVKRPHNSTLTNDKRQPAGSVLNNRYASVTRPPTGSNESWTTPASGSHLRRTLPFSSTLQTSSATDKATEPPPEEDMPGDPPPGTPPPDPPPTGSAPPPDGKNDAVLVDATLSDSKTHYEIVKLWADYQGRLSQGLGELSQDMVQNVSRVEGHH